MKFVVGLVGEKGSGKETFTDFLKIILASKKVERIRFSDVISETLKAWGIPKTRVNYQNLAIVMEKHFGPGAISHAIKLRVLSSEADVVVLDGVRWPTDAKLIRLFPNNRLVYITATPHIRYRRLKRRTEKEGESSMSFDQFMKEEKVKTELNIPIIGKNADVLIVNKGTFDELKKDVARFARKYLREESTPHSLKLPQHQSTAP